MDHLRGTPAFRTGRAWPDGIHVKFIVDAILAGVRTFVDIPVVANLPPQGLHALFVTIGGGPDVVVISQA